MAKLLDLLVAAEGFVPVAGRVYAQDYGCSVWGFSSPEFDKHSKSWNSEDPAYCGRVRYQADDYQTAIFTAEAILEARACQ
jgi:hypothetical protein